MRQPNFIGFFYLSCLAFVVGAAQSSYADVRCPERASPNDQAENGTAPAEILSIELITQGGMDEYVVEIAEEYSDLKLRVVQLVYIEDEQLLLESFVETSQLSDTHVFASLIINPSIAEDVWLYLGYFEEGTLCPKIQNFRNKIVTK